jgi:hypothetical protein
VVFDVLAEAHTAARPPVDVLVEALHDGTLPARWRAQETRLIALLGLGELNHSAAGKQLGWSRWAVADWRRRLGLTDARSHAGQR